MLKNISFLIESRQKWKLLLLLCGTIFATLLEMLSMSSIPVFVTLLTTPARILSHLPANAFGDAIRTLPEHQLILIAALLMSGLYIIKNSFLVIFVFIESRFLKNVMSKVSYRLFHGYLSSPYTFHLERNPAELLGIIIPDVINTLAVLRNYMLLFREGAVLLVVFSLMMLTEPLVSVSLFVLLGTTSTIFYLVVRHKMEWQGEEHRKHMENKIKAINQGLGAIKDAKILGRESYLLKMFNQESTSCFQLDAYRTVLLSLPRNFLEVMAIVAVLVVSATFVLLDRPFQTMMPVLTLLAVAVVRLVPSFNSITSALSLIRYNYPSFEKICDEIKLTNPFILQQSSADSTASAVVLKKEIALKNVCYQYPKAATEALKDISLNIGQGEAVAFIGTSGAGKSTLVDLVLGLLTPTSGTICVDGKDIQGNLSSWQRKIGYIPQEIYLIDDSIRRNIAFGLPDDAIDEQALLSAVEAAQLWGFMQELPNGLDTVVGNRGARLSGGQRQRIGIARALYHNPSVLVMDEATSALDNETERAVIEAIESLRGERTIIMVAHRLSTVKDCDRLFLFENGLLKDQGDFAELIQRNKHLE